MKNASVEMDVKTQDGGLTTHSAVQVGGLRAGHDRQIGFFSESQQTHFAIASVYQTEDSNSSSISQHGYRNSEQHSASIFGAGVVSRQETSIGSDGFSHHERYSIFGKKFGFGFDISPVPNLGVVDTLRRIPLPHIDFQGISHLQHLNMREIGSAIQALISAGKDSGIIEIGGQVLKVARSGAKIVVEVVEVVAEVAKAMK